MITLHQFEISPFCDKVRRILHYKGVAYQVHEISMQQAAMGVKKINPAGKLPAIEHDGRFIADSTDIAHYLEERFPDPPLLPRDPTERALCHTLEDWADESLYFYEMYLRFTLPHNAQRWIPVLCLNDTALFARVAAFIVPRHMKTVLDKQGLGRKSLDQVIADLSRHADAIAGLLGKRDFLIGAELSLADIALFAQLKAISGADEGARVIEQRGSVQSWMERVDAATSKPG